MDFEKQLVEAARAKLLRELQKEAAAGGSSVINNYGGGSPVSVKEHMAGAAVSPQGDPDEDYYVAIRRMANDKGGWDKMVRRFKTKKGEKAPKVGDLFGP